MRSAPLWAHARVTSILSDPAADPHLYESDVASALGVAEAGLVIANGAGYDNFVSQLLGATRNSGGWWCRRRRCWARTGRT